VNVTTLVLAVAAGLNTAVTPVGRPVTPKLTLPVKPFFAVTVRVALAVPDCRTCSVDTELASVNDAAPEVPVRS
jgi:hypothetical protein